MYLKRRRREFQNTILIRFNRFRSFMYKNTPYFPPGKPPINRNSPWNSPVSEKNSPVSSRLDPCVRPTQNTGGVLMSGMNRTTQPLQTDRKCDKWQSKSVTSTKEGLGLQVQLNFRTLPTCEQMPHFQLLTRTSGHIGVTISMWSSRMCMCLPQWTILVR